MNSKKADTEETQEIWPSGFEEYEKEQILFIARSTTPLQRVEWLEGMLKLLGEKYLENKS